MLGKNRGSFGILETFGTEKWSTIFKFRFLFLMTGKFQSVSGMYLKVANFL